MGRGFKKAVIWNVNVEQENHSWVSFQYVSLQKFKTFLQGGRNRAHLHVCFLLPSRWKAEKMTTYTYSKNLGHFLVSLCSKTFMYDNRNCFVLISWLFPESVIISTINAWRSWIRLKGRNKSIVFKVIVYIHGSLAEARIWNCIKLCLLRSQILKWL